MITNDSASNASLSSEKKRTFLYEYIDKSFTIEALDDILMSRLLKNKDENKFIYLI